MEVKEIIVVEGKNDVFAVKRAVNAQVVSVNGLGINDEIINFLKQLALVSDLIIFTDPDYPGEKIRNIISDNIKNVKHCFLKRSQAIKNNDVGIENASVKDIQESLKHLISYQNQNSTFTINDLIALKLINHKNSTRLREYVCDKFYLGKCNGKTLLKRLNMLNIEKDYLYTVMESYNGK